MKLQIHYRFLVLFLLGFLIPFHSFAQKTTYTTPESFFGFTPGDDRKMFDYEGLISYLKKLDEESPRLKLVEIGKSPMGKPMYIAFLSDESNINNLESLRQINRELALNPSLSDVEKEKMAKDGRVFVLATLSMHAGEVGPAQSAPLIAHKLVSTDSPKMTGWLKNVVYMMVPSHNPDGMDMIVNNYKKYVGTKYEGASLPRVYHKYVGHDNNRDFVILSQEDTRAIARIYNQTWLPQVMVEKHQMGSTGTRYFVPPNHDPIAENVDAGIWTWVGIFGQNMLNDMTNAGLAGISQHYIFDNYWPGSTETCLWNNVISFLTESASAREATPIYIESNELSVGGKGLSEYKKSINMPLPWEGGWWRLGDIVKYEIASTMSIIKTASLHKEEILKFRNDMCLREINKGLTQAPFYYIIPGKQHDESELVDLINLIRQHGIDVFTLKSDYLLNNRQFKAGDYVVPLAQPYRALIKEILESQNYPVRHYTPGGKMMKPYDITSWSLPIHRQVASYEIEIRDKGLEAVIEKVEKDINLVDKYPESFESAIFNVNNNASFKAAFIAFEQGLSVKRLNQDITLDGEVLPKGSFVIGHTKKSSDTWNMIQDEINVMPTFYKGGEDLNTIDIKAPRIALVETYFHDMDAGWTRYVFDTYHIKFTVLHPGEVEGSDLAGKFDLLIFPDNSKSMLMEGKRERNGQYSMSRYAPEYVKGLGKKGLEKVMSYIDDGGLVLSWGQSTALFEGLHKITKGKEKEEFQLPFRDISSTLQKEGLYVAGSLMKIRLTKNNPLTLGLPSEIGIFSRGRPVFSTSIPMFDMDRRVIGKYADEDVVMSGYASHEEKLFNKSAMVWFKKGKGQLVLYGFSPQFRASTQASFKLLFNAFFLPEIQ